MHQFSIELATSILHLEMQKDQILKENDLNERLCHCRLKILHNYVNVCQLFFIRFTSKIIKFLEDNNIAKTIITGDLKTWYGVEMYDKLYNKKCVSGKMVLLFKLLQDRIDKNFFKTFDKKFRHLIKSYSHKDRELFIKEFQSMYAEILDWMEMHILGILSLKIDCRRISEQIVTDYSGYISKIDDKMDSRCSATECTECINHMQACPSAELFDRDEEIHLYVTEETISDDMWLLDYFGLIEKYHDNIHDIKLVIDYILYDEHGPLIYNKNNVYRVQELAKLMKSVAIINYDYVDFGEFRGDINEYLAKR